MRGPAMIFDPRKRHGIAIVGWDRPMPIEATSGRDWTLLADWRCWWTANGALSVLVLPPGWRFGPGVNSTPGFWRALANPMHMIQSSAVHDWFYSTQGGERPVEINGVTHRSAIRGLSREFVDALAFAIAIEHGASYWSALRAWLAVRLFGRGAWNE